jgi:shikimate kinase
VIARRDTRSSIYLVGFMASGKSTVGRALAARLGWEFADTDEIVERALGRRIETIFHESGEGTFREAEWSALRSLAGRSRVVVATGGGLFLYPSHRRFLLAHGVSCWLDASMDAVLSRVADGSSRPLWPRGDALDRRAFFERRRATYALAELHVDASTGSPDDIASAVEVRRRLLFH